MIKDNYNIIACNYKSEACGKIWVIITLYNYTVSLSFIWAKKAIIYSTTMMMKDWSKPN